jgi:hypothetical protein
MFWGETVLQFFFMFNIRCTAVLSYLWITWSQSWSVYCVNGEKDTFKILAYVSAFAWNHQSNALYKTAQPAIIHKFKICWLYHSNTPEFLYLHNIHILISVGLSPFPVTDFLHLLFFIIIYQVGTKMHCPLKTY